jgi:signal transduction histidine kinase
MTALIYSGAVGMVAVTTFFAAAFFVQAWRHRRGDGEYFIFGLLALCVAVYSGVAAAVYARLGLEEAPHLRDLINVAATAIVASLALLIHFALRYLRSRWERTVMRVVYPLMTACALTVVLDAWWIDPMQVQLIAVAGVPLPVVRATPSWVAQLFFLVELLAYLVVVIGFATSYGAGRREMGAALIGSVALLASAVNDILGPAMGLYGAPPVLPFGFLAFAYAMSLTLVERYGARSHTLARQQLELERRSSELAAALAELEQTQADLVHAEQLAVVGEFAAVITHEVRNPLDIVTSAVTSLRLVRGVTDHTRSLLGIIEEEMLRLERLVSHLLDYARPVVPQQQPVDLQELLGGCLLALESFPDIEVTLASKGPWPDLEADGDLLRHAFDNLVQNAAQAMDGRGELRVRVARLWVRGVPCVVVGFEDTGEGMTEQQLEQATMPFYTSRPSGTGLGLSICDRIVEAHGGRLVIASERGAGTAISVILPLQPGARLSRP